MQADKDLFKKKLKDCHDIIRKASYDKITTIDPTKGKKYCQDMGCEFIGNCFPG